MDRYKVLDLESKGCFDFFWNEVSMHSDTYGLIKDSTANFKTHEKVSSIASVGFGLCAIVIGVERSYITYKEGYERALGTLRTFYKKLFNIEGFFHHFIFMDSGKRAFNSEISVIDTSIFIMGAMVCCEYFKGETEDLFEKIYDRVNWRFFRNEQTNRFYMGYSEKEGHFGEWDSYAEQLMMYFLGASSNTYNIPSSMFYDFNRSKFLYKGKEFIYSPFGSIFTYQFSHAFIDFRNKADKLSVDFFENSKLATLCDRDYCIENSNSFSSYSENSWGITPCDTPRGYIGALGVFPNSVENIQDGTIAPCGAISSIVFTPENSLDAMNYYYKNFKDKLWGKYGFKDSYNLDENWFCDFYIGIDKGISLLMIENYRDSIIWDLVMKNKYMKKALNILGFKSYENTFVNQ